MIIIPFRSNVSHRGPTVLVMVIEKENLDRMKEADPFDLKLKLVQGLRPEERIGNVDFVLAYEEALGPIIDFWEKKDIKGLMGWIERGRQIKPGDFGPPVPLRRA